jgi:hypothetical protein
VVDFSICDNEPSSFIKDEQLLGQLSNYHFVKKECVRFSSLQEICIQHPAEKFRRINFISCKRIILRSM